MHDFDRDFRRQRSFINIFIVVVFCLIIACWAGMGFIAYKGAEFLTSPDAAQSAGEAVGKFIKGIEKGKN